MSKKTIVKVILKTLYFRKVTNNVMNKNGLLNTIQVEEQVTPKSANRKFFCSFTFWGHLTHAYNTVLERLNKKCIFNNHK